MPALNIVVPVPGKLTLGLLIRRPDEAAIKLALPHMDAEVLEPAAPTSSIKTVDLTTNM